MDSRIQQEISIFMQQVCHREPGVKVPADLNGMAHLDILNIFLDAIWKGFYLELALETDEEKALEEALEQVLLQALEQELLAHKPEDTVGSHEWKLVSNVACLALGKSLLQRDRYVSALKIFEQLEQEEVFSKQHHWKNHLDQELALARCKSRYGVHPNQRREALWQLIQEGKNTFDTSGQWQAGLWHQVLGLKLLKEAGNELDAKWLEDSLYEQAAYYKWDELKAYLDRTKFLAGVNKARQGEFPEKFKTEKEMLGYLQWLKSEGAMDAFIGLGKGLCQRLEEEGNFKAANEVYRLILDFYEEGKSL